MDTPVTNFVNDITDLPDGHRDALLDKLTGTDSMDDDGCEDFLDSLFGEDDDED